MSDHEQIFAEISRRRLWGGQESVSGRGSDQDQTRQLIYKLRHLMQTIGAKTILDLPCGDFNWMREICFSGYRYIGADLISELIQQNNARYSSESVSFQRLDITESPLPDADLLICRDCLVHLPFQHIQAALKNIARSKIRFALITTFPAERINRDIFVGGWRPLNMCAPPFPLDPPSRLLVEGCTEAAGKFADKSLALWDVNDLRLKMNELEPNAADTYDR